MITMKELVNDPVYRKFLETKPELPKIMRDQRKMKTPPWVVYVQKEQMGKWGSKSFWKYSEAFHFMRKALKWGAWDVAINCRRMGFNPPVRRVKIKGKFITGSDGVPRQATTYVTWKPKIEHHEGEHHWCKYCRRPTFFNFYSRHRRLGPVDQTVPRCCICGASARIAITSNDKLYRVS